MAIKTKSTLKQRFLSNKYIYISQIMLTLTVIVDYRLTNNISHTLGGWFYLLPPAGITLGLLPVLKQWDLFRHKYVVLFIGYLSTALFLTLLTDIFGPYFQMLILLLFSSIYWFGISGLVYGLAAQTLTVLVAAWYQYQTLDSSLLYVILIHLATLLIVGILFERVSLKHRLGDRQSSRLMQTISFERTRLLSLINSMADAVIATDQNGKILLYNGAALDLLNTNISLDGRLINEFIDFKDEQAKSIDIINTARKSGHAVKRDDLYYISNEKQKVSLYIDIAPIYSTQSAQRRDGYIILLRDITKEKSLDEERSEFISVTSHELRTPIAIAEANISTALLPKLSKGMGKQAKELVSQAHNQIIFLGDLVNDLTTLARAERGDLDLEIEPINVKALIEKLAEDYQAEATAKGLTFKIGSAPPDQIVNNSPLYVREILQNFITNALKYTPQGGVTISAKSQGTGVLFSVADTGIGISASDKNKLFGKFYRAEDYRTRETRGTGLGLYITLKLVDRIKAKLWFKSRLNQGSTFYLQVPSLHPQRTRRSRPRG